MKMTRLIIVATTLAVAAIAGTSTGSTAQRAACGADMLTRILGNDPLAAGQVCSR